ncbi:MAG: AAA family ATPase, partial [Myxococcales bacterium]|nr:AAA family ATPase [Myxococcales bacterium]
DLKPENIVLSPLRSGGDFVKVLDFGLAKVLQVAQIATSRRITDPGMVCGTPEYMAPEQARGDDIDHRADLYACGVLLYELIAGQLPFEGGSPREVVLMHLSKMPPDLEQVAPHRKLDKAVIQVVQKALAKDPADRFQSASAFAEALNQAMRPAPKRRAPSQPSTRAGAKVACPGCDAMMPVGQKFCGECGTRMPGTVPPASETLRPPADRSSDEAAAKGASPTFPLPFVGREDELNTLLDLADRDDGLAAVTLVGHAGTGKTRLLEELEAQLLDGGHAIVWCRPDPWWVEKGYYALRNAVQALAGLPPDGGGPSLWPGASPETRAGLDAIFERQVDNKRNGRPKRRWSETPPLGPGEGSRRLLVAEALRWAIGRAHERLTEHEERGTVVLIIDDLHAIDGASCNAFADVVEDPPSLVPVMMVASHAPGFDPGWDRLERLDLKGLATNVAVRLLGVSGEQEEMRQAAEKEAAPSMAGPMGADQEGPGAKRVSPMYVEQLRRFSAEGGEDPPPKLADLIALRIERLGADARRVLQAIAVCGDATSQKQLETIAHEVKDPMGLVAELESDGFVTFEGGEVGTAHPLIRDVVLVSMPAAVKATLHSRALQAGFLDGVQQPLEAEAQHALVAGASFEALMLLERVAEQSRSRDDVAGSIKSLHQALELARLEMSRGVLDDPEAAVLMFSCKLGDALAAGGKPTDAEGVLTEALNLAGPTSPERSRLLASLANVARAAGRAEKAYRHLDEAVRIAEKVNHPNLLEMLERTRQLWIQGLP